jgi:hypothetical protein
MRLRRAVLQIPSKSSVPPRLPLHKSRSLPTPSQSTLPQLLIPLRFNSFSCNVYKKTRGRRPAADPRVRKLVTRQAPLLRTRRNPRNPSPFMELLHNLRTPRGWGLSLLYVLCALCVKNPIPTHPDLNSPTQTDPRTSSLSLFTIHYSLLTSHYSLPSLLHYFFTSSPC